MEVLALEPTTVVVLAVVFVATLIRSAFGFGEALVAVPLLALVMPTKVAVPLAVLLSIMVAGVIVAQDWRQVHFRSAGWLVLSSLAGIPLGLVLLKTVAEGIAKATLAGVIIAFSTYSLLGRRQLELKTDRLALAFGFCAGVLGGAYGMNGPPLVIYGSLRRWSPEQFRATLQGYFFPASLVGMFGYWLLDFWVEDVTYYFLVSLPAALAAIFLGRAINRRLHGTWFLRLIHIGLILVGLTLLADTIGSG
jgi:uncharacterized membrane protein YfcA